MKNFSFPHFNNSTSLREVIWMLAATSFVLPVTWNNILLAMVFMVNILTGSTKSFQSNIRQPVFWVPMLLFGWYVLSVLNSTHTTEAWHYAERKLTLFLLPLSFAFVLRVEDNVIQKVLKCYTGSVLLAAMYCLQRAYVMHQFTGSTEYYHYHNLSDFISVNAIYFSAYVAFAISLLWVNRRSWQLNTILWAGILLFLISILFLLASKLVLVVLFLFLAAQQPITGWPLKKRVTAGMATIVLVLILFLYNQIFLFLLKLNKRFLIFSLFIFSVLGFSFSHFFPYIKLPLGFEITLTGIVFFGLGYLWNFLPERINQSFSKYLILTI